MIHTEPPRTSHRPGSGIPISSLVGELKDEILKLFSTTIQLLRQELEENAEDAISAIKATSIGIGVIAVGGLLAILAIDLALIAILAPTYMAYETAAWVATSGLALLFIVTGIIVAKKNQKKLKPKNLVPHKTLKTVEEHAEWIKTKAQEISR